VVDTRTVAVDEPITMRVTVGGVGNLETLPEPVWPEISDWRSFADDSGSQMAVQNGRLAGQRVYQRILSPKSGGDYILPAIEYTYFNPDTSQYETASTDPIPVTVTGDVLPAATPPPAAAAPIPVETATNDIHHIKPVPISLTNYKLPITQSPLYWALWAIPFIVLTADFLRTRRQQQFDPVLARRSQAAQQAVQQLKRAEDDPHTAVHQALTYYLSLKLDQPITGLTQNHLRQLLHNQGVAAEMTEQVAALLHWSEIGRFAPTNGNTQTADAVAQTQQVIAELEQVL
jgi:hypothetical protein